MSIKKLFFGSSHPEYHITMMAIALVILYKVCKVERKIYKA